MPDESASDVRKRILSMNAIGRRQFLRTLSVTGAGLPLILPPNARVLFRRGASDITNARFRVAFDTDRGTFDVTHTDGRPFLAGATVALNLPDRKRALAGGDFAMEVATVAVTDVLGSGNRLVIRARDRERTTDLELHLTLHADRPAVVVEAFCTNVSGRDLVIRSFEPVRALGSEGAALHVPGATRCLTNGEMYFDTGILHEFGTEESAITSGVQKGVTLANGPFPGSAETVHSWWNAGLFSGYDLPGIALGYLDNRLGQGNLLLSRSKPDEVAFLAESVYAPERVLRAGEMVGSNPFVILLAPDPYEALERYAEAVGTANGARTRSIVNGWSSWFYTLSQVTEEEMVSQAAFAAKHLKPYGLEYIQVDEGYQRWHGDWEGNERFPSGMKGFADRIRALGLRPGIWISPYVISEPTAVYREHPEWLVKNPDGSPQRVGNWPPDFDPPEDENPKRYCLDVTHPGAAQWLHDLVHTIAHDWGYELIKIDFVAWTILAARQFHDPTASTAVAYRRGMEIMRNAAGERCHILECGPGNVTVGLIDSMRIELDYNYGYEETSWDTYFLKPASSVDSAGKRYYFHGRTWVNDVDHLCMVHMDHEQSEAAATIIGMSGGNSMSGDRLSQLDPYRLEIFRRILPASGLAAKPIDLFESDIPTAFAVRVEKAFGAWTVAAFFNRSLTETVTRRFPLSRLWLDPDATYVAFDFWCQKLVGEVRGELEVSVLPGSVTLLALHEKRDRPFVLSTDRHILQGFVELDDVRWDAPGATLSGVSLGPAGSSHNVSVYLPEPHPWTWSGSAAYRDFGPYTLKLVDEHVLQVNVRFDESERVAWRVALEELVR